MGGATRFLNIPLCSNCAAFPSVTPTPMIEYGVGVSTVRTIALKRVDSDYFEEG
jgi:hypothetical protein